MAFYIFPSQHPVSQKVLPGEMVIHLHFLQFLKYGFLYIGETKYRLVDNMAEP